MRVSWHQQGVRAKIVNTAVIVSAFADMPSLSPFAYFAVRPGVFVPSGNLCYRCVVGGATFLASTSSCDTFPHAFYSRPHRHNPDGFACSHFANCRCPLICCSTRLAGCLTIVFIAKCTFVRSTPEAVRRGANVSARSSSDISTSTSLGNGPAAPSGQSLPRVRRYDINYYSGFACTWRTGKDA